MNEAGLPELHTFLMLSGREFAAGTAEWDGERIAIGHYVHIAGKDLEDAQSELREHLSGPRVAAQVSMPVSIADLAGCSSPGELLSRLARQSGLSHNNLGVVLVDRTTGIPLQPGCDRRHAIALGLSKMLVAKRKAELAQLGVPDAVLTCRITNAIGALRENMRSGAVTGPVLCTSMLPASTQLFIVTPDAIEDIGPVDHGFANVLSQIMIELNLKFEGSAARLFFGNIYDFDEHGDSLSSPLAAKIRVRLEAYKGARPEHLMISGLPPARTRMFSRHVSMALGINQLNLPIMVEAVDGGLPTMPAVGAPSLAHMLISAASLTDSPAFFIDLNKVSLEVTDYWLADKEPERPIPVRMYRGIAFGPDGVPIVKEAAPPEPKKKILRMYRGTPIYD